MNTAIQDAIDNRLKQIKQLEKEIEALQLADEILKDKVSTEKPKTQPEMAYLVLDDIGKPMHVGQIALQIKKKFGSTIKISNLGVMLFRYAKRGKRFYKVEGKKNTYALIKWQELPERIESTSKAIQLAS
jgi:hypothetical protein